MTSIANAFRKAFGVPENNHIQEKVVHPIKQEDVLDQLDPADETRFGYGEYERTNERGFKELGFWENNRWFPICAQCGCHAMPNRGQGMICDDCDHQLMIEFQHDYDDGLL